MERSFLILADYEEEMKEKQERRKGVGANEE